MVRSVRRFFMETFEDLSNSFCSTHSSLLSKRNLPYALRQTPPSNFEKSVRLGNKVYICGDHRDTATFEGEVLRFSFRDSGFRSDKIGASRCRSHFQRRLLERLHLDPSIASICRGSLFVSDSQGLSQWLFVHLFHDHLR